jgi:hypothetical protein
MDSWLKKAKRRELGSCSIDPELGYQSGASGPRTLCVTWTTAMAGMGSPLMLLPPKGRLKNEHYD